MNLWRAWLTLVWMSFRRLLWSANTLMAMFPLGGCAMVLYFRQDWITRRAEENFELAFHEFSNDFLIWVFASFILPICTLAYATTSIGGDREDRTLLFLLVRPIPRGLILLAKFCATLPLAIGLVVGSFYLYCRLAGPVGEKAYYIFLPAIFYMTVAYTGLFHLFAVVFRHSTIVALLYALFMEFFLGNVPGIVKRVAVNFYGRSMMYDLGGSEGLVSPDPRLFVPISAQASAYALLAIALGSLLLGLLIFERREYRDLS
jgi:ABC-type transport system involved in multi-copper enzyme maturation permease subunit